MLARKGVNVIDLYQQWCGPCKAAVGFFRKIKNDLGDDLLHFATADANSIPALERYVGPCIPTFLFIAGGELVAVVRGVNAPLLRKTIIEQLEIEKKVLDNKAERKVIQDEWLIEQEKAAEEKKEEEKRKEEEKKKEEEEEEEKEKENTEEGAENEPTDEDAIVPAGKSFTLAIIKPDVVAHGKVNEIIMKIQEAGFEILAHEERTLTEDEALDFYQHKSAEPYFEELVQFMSSGPSYILIISQPESSDDVIPAWREFIGPKDIDVAKREKPESLRAQYGTETFFNAVHGSDDQDQASRELAFFFPNFKMAKKSNEEVTDVPVERTLALIRPDILKERKEEILEKIREEGFSIAMQKQVMLTEHQVREFYRDHVNEDYFPALLQSMMSGPVLAVALVKKGAVDHWKRLLGPKSIDQAREAAPESLRAQFAVDRTPINQLHGSATSEEAAKELNFFFPQEQTLAVIKPDAMEKHKDDIIESVKNQGFLITQMKETVLSREMAEEFYKEHKGKPFFEQLVDYMCRGPCMMMILSKENAVEEWRNMMGPTNPKEAKESSPGSLRARFAKDILENSVHGPSNLQHALEKIKFVFDDIGLGPNGSLQGVEPALDRADHLDALINGTEMTEETAISNDEQSEAPPDSTNQAEEEEES
ncbi:thioredoxin domain-containing protein 6 isoform X2 [Erpetoichthys calabaricus]|nr:thioredoxin domain-containing protein 6 isoform X2 [Erpetoichthys calabaricus]